MAAYQPNIAPSRPFAPGVMSIPVGPVAPAGTFLPGTKVQCGNHRVVIDKYLSEGGFAHVYVVTLPKPVDGKEKAVLKRVAVSDKEQLAEMRNEVETMKRLRGHKQIVKYIDSHASSLKNGGYEVFLLMEWCNGGGLIDFMNTRLQNRLTEPEILKIFTDIAEGVACMHYLKPPLMHRDLKVENVLISTEGKSRTFKLCDFGSAAPARPAATTAAEGRLVEDDVQRHTTLQYRSPEMIDVYRKQPINEKSDIWALGCFLYKLCYYTTPFEEVGQMAILNASFKYPGYPRFSDDLKLLIASMLREQPSQRPNIYQVLAKASKLDGRPLSIRDIYTGRSQSADTRSQAPPKPSSSQPPSGAAVAPPKQEAALSIPQVEPMRRGRPLKPMSHHNSAKPSPSPLRMMDHADAFSGLDHGGNGGDELSSKFPRLEEFALMTDKDSNFAFQTSRQKPNDSSQSDLAQRVTQALADEAFARPASPPKSAALTASKTDDPRSSEVLQSKRPIETKEARLPQRSQMVSTGTMTSPSPPPSKFPPISNKPVWRVPEKDTVERSASIMQASSKTKPIISKDRGNTRLANLLSEDASRSQLGHDLEPRSPTSSRPSLEGGRPMLRELNSGVQRSKSLNSRNRPVSVNMVTRPTHVNDKETRHAESEAKFPNTDKDLPPLTHVASDQPHSNIVSDIDYLRAREEEEKGKHKHMKRLSGGGSRHQKRASLPSAALSGTKNLLQGRFGEAFRKFEGHQDDDNEFDSMMSSHRDGHNPLSPIEGSVATDLSDDRRGMDETEELPPELRRELEKQKLEAEERRVERAAAEYKQRMDVRGTGPPPVSAKAASIQNRVQSLLKDSDRPSQKTATGYGRFTADVQPNTNQPYASSSGYPNTQHDIKAMSAPASATDLQAQTRISRPVAPPKPQTLRTGVNDGAAQQVNIARDDWEDDFSKKYPAIPQIDITETGIESRPKEHHLRMREI